MNWQVPVIGKRGRQPTFFDAAIQFCRTIKCLFGLALRQASGMVESMLRLAGLDWAVPDFSTLSRRQWRKPHLGIDAKTLEIWTMEVEDVNGNWLSAPPSRAPT